MGTTKYEAAHSCAQPKKYEKNINIVCISLHSEGSADYGRKKKSRILQKIQKSKNPKKNIKIKSKNIVIIFIIALSFFTSCNSVLLLLLSIPRILLLLFYALFTSLFFLTF